MPFDTTYNIVFAQDSFESLIITTPGGIDTSIYIKETELPDLLKHHPNLSKRVIEYQEGLKSNKAEIKNSNTAFQILVLIFIVSIAIAIKHNWASVKATIKKLTLVEIVLIVCMAGFVALIATGYFGFALVVLITAILLVGEFKKELFYSKNILKDSDESGVLQVTSSNNEASVLQYEGYQLNFSDTEIEKALIKRFPYYKDIGDENKERFIHRVRKFIADKTFYIHDESGFKEMPILISAAAIQLTFGLKKYLLPYFKNIHVFPEEFFRANDMGVCFLAGNVSGNNINLSWKHFLHGYQDGTDGQNVGLHELAHALYYQALVVERGVDEGFTGCYNNFVNHGNKVYDAEMNPVGGLYSEYANKNFQEFWAESAEIFFERPEQLKALYPDLYQTLKEAFNQDPLNLQTIPLG